MLAGKEQVRKRLAAGLMTPMIQHMVLDADAAYLAVKARDARFDGRLFIGVTTAPRGNPSANRKRRHSIRAAAQCGTR